jgi:hypothetical protein
MDSRKFDGSPIEKEIKAVDTAMQELLTAMYKLGFENGAQAVKEAIKKEVEKEAKDGKQ